MHRLFHPRFVFQSLLLLIIIVGSISARAETLQKYREDIETLQEKLSFLGAVTEDDVEDGWTKQDLLESENDFAESLKTLLPEKENVEWDGITTEVDNRWLHLRFADLTALPHDSNDRNKIVTELDQRLSGILAKLKEAEMLSAGTRNKAEEKEKLDRILQRPEYQKQDPEDQSAIERWINAFLDWLRDLLPRESPSPARPVQESDVRTSPILVMVLVILAALAILGFVIWKIAPLIGLRGTRKKEKKDKGERIILGEKLAADESSTTLFDQAEHMARTGDFRGAIRKGYIAMLCELGDRKIVRIAQHKTNRDYLSDIRKHQSLYGGVKDLTFMFEVHWYGLANASEDDWSKFRENYQRNAEAI